MRVREIWRYPVKSAQGERVDTSEVDTFGVAGDRRWALFDVETGYGLTARRQPELLFASGRTGSDGTPEIILPDGSVAADDGALSDWLGRPVELRAADTAGPEPTYENPEDFETDAPDIWQPFTGATGAFHDSARTRVSLVSAGTLRDWDRRRFRANVVLDGAGEDDLVGHRIKIGDAVLTVGAYISRCVMVTRPQQDGIERDLSVLRTIHRERSGRLAVGALVAEPGTIAVGDDLEVLPSDA